MGLEDAAVATTTSSDEAGDYFNMALAIKVPVSEVRHNAIVLVPLSATADGAVMTSTSLAAGPTMYVQLNGLPQLRMVFGSCVGYSDDTVDQVIATTTLVKFPPPQYLFIAKDVLVDALASLSDTVLDEAGATEEVARKRLCVRPPEDGVGLTDASVERGTYKYILDLDGGKHPTRNKSDIAVREKDLGFAFRAVDRDRWEFIMGTDFLLQPEEYRFTILQQGRLRADHRHRAFKSCGFLDRVQGLHIPQKTGHLKLLITGQILVEGDSPTLTLEDFTSGEKISSGIAVCAQQNRPLVQALKNLQIILQVFLSGFFEGCLDLFIFDLEGSQRPMELVAADFLLYSIEELLRKFFRVIRSERSSTSSEEVPVTTPEECAAYLGSLFSKLSVDLSDHVSRAVEEDYFRMRLIREASIVAKSLTPKKSPEKKKVSPMRPCAGHLGKQLKAIYPDGRPYKCNFGKGCIFKHVGKSGKTEKDLQDIISLMPAAAQEDLKKATKNRT